MSFPDSNNPYSNVADPMLDPLRSPYTDVKQAERIRQAWREKYRVRSIIEPTEARMRRTNDANPHE